MNCNVAPATTTGFVGATDMATKVGGALTVNRVVPVTPLNVAEIVVVPAASPVARPPALTVAAEVLDEAHATWLLKFCALPSEYVPVALNCCPAPANMVWLAGVTLIEIKVGTTEG